MSEPTRLSPEDLPTLRKLAAFWDERRQHDFAHAGWTLFRKVACGVYVTFARRAITAIERTGHLASDERVDKYGRVDRP